MFLDSVTREGFRTAHEISSYSFAALARALRPMMSDGAAMLTLSYIGSQRSMPGYNVMGLAKASLEANVRYLAQSLGDDGIRVNGISAGPIKTLAASGIRGLKKMMKFYENTAPLGRGVTIEEVGNTAAFLCSDLASGITGEITYGLERVALYLQDKDNIFDLSWNAELSYGDLYRQNEVEQSAYNFEHADVPALLHQFDVCEKACLKLLEVNLPLPAYEQVLKASHTFNLLDARHAIGVTERARYIGRVRTLARGVAENYYQRRQQLGFPRGLNRRDDSRAI
jgi:hypothetical protein